VDPTQKIGQRISNMMLKGEPVDPNKIYKVAGWAPVGEGVSGTPIWDVVAEYLRSKKVIKNVNLNMPKITGISPNNPGIAV
jgi:sulfur-oxidizing protein SoxB